MEASESVDNDADVLWLWKLTRADQKLVSFMDLSAGRSRMKWPNCELSQKPPLTASDVQTYVFCYVLPDEHVWWRRAGAHSQACRSRST